MFIPPLHVRASYATHWPPAVLKKKGTFCKWGRAVPPAQIVVGLHFPQFLAQIKSPLLRLFVLKSNVLEYRAKRTWYHCPNTYGLYKAPFYTLLWKSSMWIKLIQTSWYSNQLIYILFVYIHLYVFIHLKNQDQSIDLFWHNLCANIVLKEWFVLKIPIIPINKLSRFKHCINMHIFL